jgi:6-pyruvoyltetrahydropterin/6-carboxytetrahydropterin synthase
VNRPGWSLRLAKEDFKFSVAHFTLFGPAKAETLHGHNYRISLEIEGDELDEAGLLADTDALKRRLREICAELDDKVLLPERSPWLEIRAEAEAVECRFGERLYRFPAAEVVLLPLVNTSMELLARWTWRAVAGDLASPRLRWLTVEIGETPGQASRYGAPLGSMR